MSRSFDVSLNDVLVGHLYELDEGWTAFRIAESYRARLDRPVLSQSFEDDLSRTYRGSRGTIPSFFANLIPEGPLRQLVEASAKLTPGDDLAFLHKVGHDLPGAVEIRPSTVEPDMAESEDAGSLDVEADRESEEDGLRFSLAGVQLKFSVLRQGEKLALPARGRRGEWIVKFDSAVFQGVAENEFATLAWARAAGFDVPENHLQSVQDLAPTVRRYARHDTQVLVVKRYDRENGLRVHQEDFAQVAGVVPRLKYGQVTCEGCATLVRRIVGEEAYFEFVRRVAFVVASGNADAHLKNWSFVYPDGVSARLSPLYDQVSTIAWPDVERQLALKFAGKRRFEEIDEGSFGVLAKKSGGDQRRTIAEAQQTIAGLASAWKASPASDVMPQEHVKALRAHWKRVPLLRRHASPFD